VKLMISRNKARMASAVLGVLSASLLVGVCIVENAPTARATLLSMMVNGMPVAVSLSVNI
jgi:hypothetical protein